MYETESNTRIESASQVPPEALTAFGELKGKILARTLISWSEHCTECGWPTCYTTCELYAPREDGKCRRFIDGMVRVDSAESLTPYLLKIRFKRWGMLWARGNFQLHSVSQANRLEERDYRIGTALQRIPLPENIKRNVTEKRYAFKNRLASRGAREGDAPTSFLLECYNPQPQAISLSLRIRTLHSAHRFPNLIQLAPGFRQARELTESEIPFETLITVAPGFHRTSIPFAQIAPLVDLRAPYRIDITPNEVEDGATLYFGTMDFVQEVSAPAGKVKKVKCVVWDLDNTLWDGTLVEDGQDKLRLKPGVVEIIQELDRRGILQSIASKNNPEEALQVLKKFQLDEYFLCPQISWQPKSEGIRNIASGLNIGVDTLLFVDDTNFELQQVQAVHPDVRIMHADQYLTLPDTDACKVPATAEAAMRRRLYQVEATRQRAAVGFGQDYLAFLKDCNIELEIRTLTPENLDRVHELTQRTNQMNFSGNRYDREVLKRILSTPDLDTYVLECKDRFGSYGVVGFSIVERREPRMTDLMFSCRIQGKRVEHAFVAFLLRKYIAESGRDFHADYRKNPRNAPAGRVFGDLGMQEVGARGDVSLLVFPKGLALHDDGIVNVKVCEESVGHGVDH